MQMSEQVFFFLHKIVPGEARLFVFKYFFCVCKYVYVIISPYLIKNMKYKKIKRRTSLNFMIYFTK